MYGPRAPTENKVAPFKGWDIGAEWVYNGADIDHKRVVFAHDFGTEQNWNLPDSNQSSSWTRWWRHAASWERNRSLSRPTSNLRSTICEFGGTQNRERSAASDQALKKSQSEPESRQRYFASTKILKPSEARAWRERTKCRCRQRPRRRCA